MRGKPKFLRLQKIILSNYSTYVQGRGVVNQAHAKWLKQTIQIHTGHLMSTPHCEEILGPVYSLIENRTRHYSMALQLKGKLDMMTRQVTAKPDDAEKDEIASREALLGMLK